MLFICCVLSAQDCLSYMQAGSELIKVRSNSRQYHRIFSLNSDMTEVRWQPTSKKPHKARSKCTSNFSFTCCYSLPLQLNHLSKALLLRPFANTCN